MTKWINLSEIMDTDSFFRGYDKVTNALLTITSPNGNYSTVHVVRHDKKRGKIWAKFVGGS